MSGKKRVLGCPPPEIAYPIKAKELNLPEAAAEAGDPAALEAVEVDEVEPDVNVNEDVIPASS
jgi:hypothetical protein